GLTGTALSLLGMIFASSIEWLFPIAFIYGLIAAGNVVVQSIIWANYFGREFIGSIRGVLMPFSLISSAGGPLIAAAVFDITGSYRPIFILFFVFWLIAASLMTMAKPPIPPSMAEMPEAPGLRRVAR
ncbi:MAG TPA: hypothetical protein VJM69_03485, partial [Dehalococcoidia bacterium]|nr:hypothetical protein [Dehalococcoidia bacterium]